MSIADITTDLQGIKRHLITERRSIPLAFLLIGTHVHDSMPFEDLLDVAPHVAGKRARPRRRPDKLHAYNAAASALVCAAKSGRASPGAASTPFKNSAAVDG